MTKKFALWLLAAMIFSTASAEVVTINAPVASMHKMAGFDSPVISSAIYATSAEVVDRSGTDWLLIKTPDGYRGWVTTKSTFAANLVLGKNLVEVRNLFANIYQDPTTTDHAVVLTAPYSTKLPLIKILNERWLMVRLVDGSTGYIQKGDVEINPQPLTLEEMLAESKKFIGLPFTWGGVSSYGFDCSGFVQMLYKQMGILLPRDGGLQINDPRLIAVDKSNLQPGDLLFFKQNNHIDHAGLYLGENQFISATPYKTPIVQISNIDEQHWQDIYYAARRLVPKAKEFASSVTPIPNNIKKQMLQYTWREGCPVALDDLVYIKLSYWGLDNQPHQGELIVHKDISSEVVAIFHDLYQQQFPIAKMQLMEAYKGDDTAADNDNNTSAFNCRPQVNFPKLFSAHSYGKAIDLNPLFNPYVNGTEIIPDTGKKYLTNDTPGKILANSLVYQDFTSRGWAWGGDWTGKIHDYQHFEKS